MSDEDSEGGRGAHRAGSRSPNGSWDSWQGLESEDRTAADFRFIPRRTDELDRSGVPHSCPPPSHAASCCSTSVRHIELQTEKER
eukprot:1963507-Rhodomonas_salina.3